MHKKHRKTINTLAWSAEACRDEERDKTKDAAAITVSFNITGQSYVSKELHKDVIIKKASLLNVALNNLQ